MPAARLEYHDVEHFKCNDLRRWKFAVGDLFSVRLHHWVEGDPPDYQHAHPWNFLTIVLWGGYDDVGPCPYCKGHGVLSNRIFNDLCAVCHGTGRVVRDRVRAPCVRYRDTQWRHSVINCLPHTWTIVITGRVVDNWRFWIKERQVDEAEWNLRTCD